MTWEDARHDSEFDGDPLTREVELAQLKNIGYFVKMTRKVLVLATCKEPSTQTVRWMDDIPRVLVKSIESLEEKHASPVAKK